MRYLILTAVLLLIGHRALAASKIYQHDSSSSLSGYKVQDFGAGTGVTTAVTNTAAGPTSGIQITKTAGGTTVKWITCPLEAVTISGPITMNAWGQQSNVAANTGWQVTLHQFDSVEGAAFFTSQAPGSACQASGTNCTETSTSNGVTKWSQTPASPVSIPAGTRLVAKWFINDAGGTMASGRTATFRYDGTTGGASGDTWVETTETLACQPPIQPVLLHGFDEGVFTGDWTTGGGSAPAVVYESGQWWAEFNPADLVAEYADVAIAGGGQDHTLHATFRVKSFPLATCSGGPLDGQGCDPFSGSFPCTILGACSIANEARLVEVRSSAASPSTQALATLGSDRRLRVYFNQPDPECTLNSLYKFSACALDSQCIQDVGGNEGEAACAQAVFAQSRVLEPDTTYRLAIMSDSDLAAARPYDVTIQAYLDGRQIGEKTRWQGVCVGIDLFGLNFACGAQSDCQYICDNSDGCSTPGTCTDPGTIGNATHVRLGVGTGAATRAVDYLIRDVVFTPSNADPFARYVKLAPLWPTGDSAVQFVVDTGGCGTNAACMDDTNGGGALDTGTLLRDSTQNHTDLYSLTDYTIDTGEAVIGAMARGTFRETDNSNTGKFVLSGLRDSGSNEVIGTAVDLSATPGGNLQIVPGAITMTMPGGASFTQTNVNALRGLIRYTGVSGTTNQRVFASNYVANLLVALPQPPVTDYFPDINNDGVKRLAVIGDSVMNDPALYESLLGTLFEAGSVLRCALGGRKIADLTQLWCTDGSTPGAVCTVENGSCPGGGTCRRPIDLMLDGVTTGRQGTKSFPCVAERGETGKVDVALIHIAVNDFSRVIDQMDNDGTCYQRGCVGGANAGQACKTTAADCPGGTCTDLMGPNQDEECQIVEGVKADNAQFWFSSSSYFVRGDKVGESCTPTTAQDGPGGCAGGANNDMPCTGLTKVADCGAGINCNEWDGEGGQDLEDADAGYTYGWCVPSGLDPVNCPRGACLHQVTTAYISGMWQKMLDTAEARTGADEVKIVLLGNTDVSIDTSKRCVGGADHLDECVDDTDCTSPGKCKRSAGWQWEAGLDHVRWHAQYLKALARERNLGFFDLGSYQRRLALPDTNANKYNRDGVHQNDDGQILMGDAITACAERDTSVPENKCGDLTVTLTCPTAAEGLVPYADPETPDTGRNDRIIGSPWCVPASSQTVDAIGVRIATAPLPAAHVQCSVYTQGVGFNVAKTGTGCDTASTLVSQAGWLEMPVSDPANCQLAVGSTYWILCSTDDAALGWSKAANARVTTRLMNGATPYGSFPASGTMNAIALSYAEPFYLQTHAN